MGTGSFDYSPDSSSLTDDATPIGVYRYAPTDDESPYTYMPNVWCNQIQIREGSHPPTAQFSYVLDDSGTTNENYPSQFEQLWPINSPVSDYKVQAGDRIVILETDPEGNYRVLWDGFAQLPQTDLGPGEQSVTFAGVGTAVRMWDSVIGGRIQRDASTPRTPDSDDLNTSVATDLPTRFNPADPSSYAGRANKTPDNTDNTLDDDSGNMYPLFMEPNVPPDPSGTPANQTLQPAYWGMGETCRYLFATANTQTDANGDLWVDNPDFAVLDLLLGNREPNAQTYDPSDSSTYQDQTLLIRDLDVTNKPLGDVLESLLDPAGFRYRFVTEGQSSGEAGVGQPIVETPYTHLEVYRFDAAGPTTPKTIQIQPSHTPMDPTQNNVSSFSAVNDFHGVANQWEIETEPVSYEVSILLAPAFLAYASDAMAANRKQYLLSNLDNATGPIRNTYRLYVVDETGLDGHANQDSQEWIQGTPFDFTDLFPPADDWTSVPSADVDAPPPVSSFVQRYRPAKPKLFSKDSTGKPYRAQLSFSRDYQNASPPCLWDGSGTWQNIQGGWHLLKDKLGIYVDIEDPEAWDVGKPGPSEAVVEASGVLKSITSLGNPNYANKQFYLRLTCVIESDHCLDVTATKRVASPYPYAITRRIDTKNIFKKEVISSYSVFNTSGQNTISRDDSQSALAYANQLRAAHEFPPISATVTIPWFSKSYQVGDRISYIDGRNVSLQVNAASEQGEEPSYPFIVGVTWEFGREQRTVLQLSDRRSEPRLK